VACSSEPAVDEPAPPAEVVAPAEPDGLGAAGDEAGEEELTSYAYVVDWRADTEDAIEIGFDFVDWFTGDEAVEMFMQDNPGMSRADAEVNVEEFGFIRNVNPLVRWFSVDSNSILFVRDESGYTDAVEVSFQEWRDAMKTAIDTGAAMDTFFEIWTEGEHLARAEWRYHP